MNITSIILTWLLALGLHVGHWQTREACQGALRVFGDWNTVTSLWASSTDPEQRARLQSIRASLTVREVDRIAGGTYPDADDLRWPCKDSLEYHESGVPEMYRVPYESIFNASRGCDDSFMDTWHTMQRHRTRAGLIAYVSRTGDWRTVCQTLRR